MCVSDYNGLSSDASFSSGPRVSSRLRRSRDHGPGRPPSAPGRGDPEDEPRAPLATSRRRHRDGPKNPRGHSAAPRIRTGRRDGSGPRPHDRFSVPEADLLSLFVRPLNQLGWAYAVTGAVGSMFYSEPRFTNDIDVVVRIPSDGGPELRKAFPEPEFYRPGLEEISVEASRPSRGHLNVIHLESGLKADFYLVGTDPLNDWALSAAKIIPVGDLPVRVAPPEYVVLRKARLLSGGRVREAPP